MPRHTPRPEPEPARPARSAARAHPRAEAEPPPDDAQRVVERPDGFHWIDETGHQEFGPFPTAASALEDMAGDSARGDEEVDALRIAESGIDVGAEQREAPGDDPPEEAA